MNFQVTVLKVLVSYPGGFAVMADLKRDVALLATSGRDWVDRTKRLGARVPDLDIFSHHLVDRVDGGWRITEKGRLVLDEMESRTAPEASSLNEQTAPPDPVHIDGPRPAQPLAFNNQRRQTRLRRRRKAALKAASPARDGMVS